MNGNLPALSQQSPIPKASVFKTRRRHVRFGGQNVAVVFAGLDLEVYDWSFGGVRFDARGTLLRPGQKVQLTLRYRLFHLAMDIPVEGIISRADAHGTVARFGMLDRRVFRPLGNVLTGFFGLTAGLSLS